MHLVDIYSHHFLHINVNEIFRYLQYVYGYHNKTNMVNKILILFKIYSDRIILIYKYDCQKIFENDDYLLVKDYSVE
jgi:hypothetical protein